MSVRRDTSSDAAAALMAARPHRSPEPSIPAATAAARARTMTEALRLSGLVIRQLRGLVKQPRLRRQMETAEILIGLELAYAEVETETGSGVPDQAGVAREARAAPAAPPHGGTRGVAGGVPSEHVGEAVRSEHGESRD